MISRTTSRHVVLLCLLVAAGEFCVRGPARAIRFGKFNDFSGMYVASRRWIEGTDPYQSSHFKTTWVASGGEYFGGNRGSESNLRPVYPPSSLPVLAIFAFFRWLPARSLFLLSAVALFPLLLWAVLRLGRLQWRSNAGLFSCAFALALAPWHAAIASQSITAQAVELAVIGACLTSQIAGGVLIGLALCLKPQMVLWFVFYEIAKKQWCRVLTTCVAFAAVTLLALNRMPNSWLDSYRDNLRYFFATGDVNDFTLANPIRFDLLNVQVPLYYITRISRLANVLSCMITALLTFFWSRRRYQSDCARLAAIVLIGLLPVYQRTYNAGVVVIVLPYAISRWSETRCKPLTALCGVFLVPGTAVLQTLHEHHWVSDFAWNQNWWVNLLLGPHATWAILGIVAVLLFSPESAGLRDPLRLGQAVERASGTNRPGVVRNSRVP